MGMQLNCHISLLLTFCILSTFTWFILARYIQNLYQIHHIHCSTHSSGDFLRLLPKMYVVYENLGFFIGFCPSKVSIIYFLVYSKLLCEVLLITFWIVIRLFYVPF